MRTSDELNEQHPSRRWWFPGASLMAVLLGAMVVERACAQTAPAPGKGAGPRLGDISQVELTVTNRAQADVLVRAGYDVDGVFDQRVRL
jgi:hypothetical protein